MSSKNFGINAKSAVLALALFAAATGIVGFLYNRNTKEAQTVTLQEPVVENLSAETQSAGLIEESTQPASRPAVSPAQKNKSPRRNLPRKISGRSSGSDGCSTTEDRFSGFRMYD